MIICDDVLKPEDAHSEVKREKANRYLQSTLLSRLEDKQNGAMILVQQRLHVDDATGHLLDRGDWDHLSLPAIATKEESIPVGDEQWFHRKPGDPLDPMREDAETLQKIRSEVGESVFMAQWQQLPVLPGGNMLKHEQFQRYDELPPAHYIQYYVQSWDTAVTASDTSDWSVCTTWAKCGNRHYLVDVFRAKLEYPDLRKVVEEQFLKHKPRLVIVEGSHIGKALIAEFYRSKYCRLTQEGPIVFQTLNPTVSKEERAAVQSVKIEKGLVFLPNNALWLEVFEKEILEFPAGKHDDQVDSMIQYLLSMDYRIPKVNW